MQTPAQIEFEGVQASAELRSATEQLVAKLETRFDRVTIMPSYKNRKTRGGIHAR
jgi:hypothetical protein